MSDGVGSIVVNVSDMVYTNSVSQLSMIVLHERTNLP